MKSALIGLATMTMISVPAFADHTPTVGQRFAQGVTKENVGRAVGATVGALVGSQIGNGRGQLAAVAGGTVAGYILGGKVGRNSAAKQHASSYRSQPVYTSSRSTSQSTSRVRAARTSFKQPLTAAPPLEMIDGFYLADTKSNVRGGPGTDYLVVDQLHQGEQVAVIGKVIGKDWYMVSENGIGTGFVYAPLLSPLPNYGSYNTQSNVGYNSVNYSNTSFNMPAHTTPQYSANQGAAQPNQCSVFTQQITLPDGTSATRNIEACQRADGSWEEA